MIEIHGKESVMNHYTLVIEIHGNESVMNHYTLVIEIHGKESVMNQYRLVSAKEKTISNIREEFVSSQTGLWMLVMMVVSYVKVNGGADISPSLVAS